MVIEADARDQWRPEAAGRRTWTEDGVEDPEIAAGGGERGPIDRVGKVEKKRPCF